MSTAGPGPQRPALTLSEAAAAVSRDRRTVRRQLDAGRFPNAYQEPGRNGQWRIPITDLAAAGFRVNAPSEPESAPPAPPDVEELARLRAENAVLRERAAAAEALAAHQAASAQHERRAFEIAIAALTSSERPRAPEPEPPVLDVELVPEPADVEPEPKRRRRWRRAR